MHELHVTLVDLSTPISFEVQMIYMLLAERAGKSSMTNYNTQGCCATVVEVLLTIRPANTDPKVQAAAQLIYVSGIV
jgi:hypothetical protein